MKKTLIALLALGGVAAADSLPLPVASVTDYTITGSGIVSFSDPEGGWSEFAGKIDAASGFTLQITLSNWSNAHGPLFLLSTKLGDEAKHDTSLVTVGYTNANGINGWKGATVYNSSSGSSTTGNVTYADISGKDLPSHVTSISSDVSLFVTGKNGAITLYEVDSSNKLVKIATTTNLTTGTAVGIEFAQWSNASDKQNANRATIDITAYSGVLTTQQMGTLAVPEPTTATLSLLALAGLAARRRRK